MQSMAVDEVDEPVSKGATDAVCCATPANEDMTKAAPNHSPKFDLDERALITGVRALAALATDFLTATR